MARFDGVTPMNQRQANRAYLKIAAIIHRMGDIVTEQNFIFDGVQCSKADRDRYERLAREHSRLYVRLGEAVDDLEV